jgi:hypothetical protein
MLSRIKSLSLLLIAAVIASCTTIYEDDEEWPPVCCPQIKKELPPGNADKFVDTLYINSADDEIAPVQRPAPHDHEYFDSPCYREFAAAEQSPLDGVKASSNWAKKHFRFNLEQKKYFTKNIESLTFVNNRQGFVSLSHPPDKAYAVFINLDIDDPSGGTDIFEFELDSEKNFEFEKLNNPGTVNSEFWDSHPFAFDTVIAGNQFRVMLWASDRDAPFTKGIDKYGNVFALGHSDLYYAFKVNGEWKEHKKLQGDISTGAFEGSPFIYCICKNPLLLFSTNRNDSTPRMLENEMREDFDIDSVRISIDFENLKISQNGPVGSFRKSRQDAFAYEGYKPDSTINTDADERFPYVAFPMDDPETKYIYFSSNRNRRETPVYGAEDSVIVSKGGFGGYDIYRFPFDVGCKPPPKPPVEPRLVVHVLDAATGEYAEGPTIVKVNKYDAEIDESPSEGNPAEFYLESGKQYSVFGGSSYRASAAECREVAKNYFAPDENIRLYSMEKTETDTVETEFNADQIKKYYEGPVEIVKSGEERFFAGRKYTGTLTIKEKLLQSRRSQADENLFFGNIIRRKTFTVDSHRVWQTKTGGEIEFVDNFEEVRKGNIESERTKNGGIYTMDLQPATTLHDTVYVAPWRDTVRCLDLRVQVADKCDMDAKVPETCIRLEQFIPETGEYEDVTEERRFDRGEGFAWFSLLEGHVYRVLGGSDFEASGKCPDRLYYVGARKYEEFDCPLIKSGDIEFDKAKCSSVLSELSVNQGAIYTDDYLAAGKDAIHDLVLLKLVRIKKPPCRYEFTEIQDSLHRKVPYFQTGFWEVNTTRNLRKHLYMLNKPGSIYRKPYSQDSPPPEVGNWGPWHWGAKWIELHPYNTYWAASKQRRQNRIYQYRRYATRVDENLGQMQKVITRNLIPLYQLLDSLGKCEDCPENKFIIRMKAWSDYRCVTHGWYIGPPVEYWQAEYEPYSTGDLKQIVKPEMVRIEEDDPLGCDNDHLSELRAYHGYHELLERLKQDKIFKSYLDRGEVLMPDDPSINSKDEFFEKFKQAKIIILTKGFRTAPPEKVDVQAYKKVGRKTSFYDLDTTRSVDVIVESIGYMDGKVYNDECCDTTKYWYEIDQSELQRKAEKFLRNKPVRKSDKYAILFSPVNKEIASGLRSRIRSASGYRAKSEEIPGRDNLLKLIIGPFDKINDAQTAAEKMEDMPEAKLMKIVPYRK